MTKKERNFVKALERRATFLEQRVAQMKDRHLSWDAREAAAIRWALERLTQLGITTTGVSVTDGSGQAAN